MTPVGFEPTQLALVELESTPLDHSGKVSLLISEWGLTMTERKPAKHRTKQNKAPKTNGC